MSRYARLWRIAAGAAGLLLVACLAVGVPGAIERYDPARGSAPDWIRPCMDAPPRADRLLLSRCSRVRGRVLMARREAGEGALPETHLAVVARLHLFVVKLRPEMAAPRVGATIVVVGPLVRARNGLREVEARVLRPA